MQADPAYPCEHSTVAAVSAAILADLYPDEAGFLATTVAEHEESRLWAGASFPSDVAAGDSLGRDVAKLVIAHARADGADAPWAGELAAGEGRWFSASNDRPTLPLWGRVTPWLMSAGSQFRAKPPPAFGSAAFNAALGDLRRIAATRTDEQARIAALWADGLGSYAPPGRWNKIAADLIQKHRLNEIRSARALALLNMVLMDASIACWDTKYHYLVIRPPQADPAIPTPIGLPNFPSYPSAHATFSGAAAELLGHLFADEAQALRHKAGEAAASREYGGIHYRFDGEAGIAQGRAVAQLGIERGRTDGSP